MVLETFSLEGQVGIVTGAGQGLGKVFALSIDVNLNGLFYCCQAVAKPMIERRSGRIINIASMLGMIVNRPQAQASYNATRLR
jgi:NAD(P)-dependent dehydrogenase (short-subunit alcohol dehydrogenase family)